MDALLKKLLLSLVFLEISLYSFSIHPTPISKSGTKSFYLQGSPSFVENKGQITDESGKFRPDVFYVAKFSGMDVFFTNHGVVYYFKKVTPAKLDLIRAGKIPDPYTDREWDEINRNGASGDDAKAELKAYRIDLHFPGTKLKKPKGFGELAQKNNYFAPAYPDGIMGVPSFKGIRYNDAYPGIDLVFHITDGRLKYDFEVSANANPALIKILYEGQQAINIKENGSVAVKILPGEIIEDAPKSFQKGKQIESQFLVSNDTIMFHLGKYDKQQPLTIDPTLEWCTFFHDGSTSASFTFSRPVWDSNDNMYVVVNTYNRTNFPLIDPGGSAYYDGTAGSTGLQLVIMKFNSSRQIVWATYYSSSQSARTAFSNQSIAVDNSDNLYVIGELSFVYSSPTPSFPTYDPGGSTYYEVNIGNGRDFILKFSSTGERLWATIFHSSVNDGSAGLDLYCVAIDNNNKLLIGGQAYTPVNYRDPIPLKDPGGNAYYESSPVEDQVPVIGRFSSSGVLEWCTYISEGEADTYNAGDAMTVDDNNNIFFVGTAGQEFNGGTPSTYNIVDPGGGAYQDNNNTGTNNGRKCVIFKFNSSLQITWSTLYGGDTRHNYNGSGGSVTWQDFYDLDTDGSGNVFIIGRVNTTDFPLKDPGSGAYYQSTFSSGGSYHQDGVIVKFNNDGVQKWSTYYGGDGTSDGTQLYGLGIDGNDNVYISGITRNNDFPIQSKSGSYNQSSFSGSYALVLLEFDNSGVRQWASYFGNETFFSSGGFGVKSAGCGGAFTQFGTITSSGSMTTEDPGGSAYYESSKESGSTSDDFIVEFSEGGGGGSASGTITWTGSVSEDWFEPCNWDKKAVPTSSNPVVIPAGTSNKPHIYDNSQGDAECYTIEIESGSSNAGHLYINTDSGGKLKVSGP